MSQAITGERSRPAVVGLAGEPTAIDFNTPGMTRGIATWDGTFDVKLGGH